MRGNLKLLGSSYLFSFREQELVLDAHKAIYWKQEQTLVVSDLHLGKAGHFRKHGVPVPKQVHITDLQKLNLLLEKYGAKRVIFLGDLFHSDGNEEWFDFVEWSSYHKNLEQVLVEGNHDILGKSSYSQTRMVVMEEFRVGPFHFTHDQVDSDLYNLSGHVHPCVKLHGVARQGVRLPCFRFGLSAGLVPAFGEFTGNHPITLKKSDHVFAIAEGQLIGLVD